MRRIVVALALLGATAGPQEVSPYQVGAINAEPNAVRSSLDTVCYGASSCINMQWGAYGAVLSAYWSAKPRQQVKIVQALDGETSAAGTNWYNAANILGIDAFPISASYDPPRPPSSIHCYADISKNGRHISSACY